MNYEVSSLTAKYHLLPCVTAVMLPSDTLSGTSSASGSCVMLICLTLLCWVFKWILLRSLNPLTPVQPSLLWPLALWIPTCLVPHIPLHLLNSGSPVFPLSVLWPENTLKAISWGHPWTHTVSFPSLKGHCPSLPDAQYFPQNSSCLLVVSYGRVHPAHYSILVGSRNCKSIFNFLKFPNLFFKLHIWIYELRYLFIQKEVY